MTGTKSLGIDRRGWVRVALGLLLLSPYLIWLASISSWHWPALASWWPAVRYAGVQALTSSVLTLGLGGLLFRALQAWDRRRGLGEVLLLLPNLIPPLFVAMALLSFFTSWMAFPYGLAAVIVAHVLLNSGLVAIALDRAVRARVGGMAEAAWVMGVSPWNFVRAVALPQLRGDLACLFLFVFSLCFTSFSIPLLLSGARAVSLEVAIFDAIRSEGAWDKAVLLAALQSSVLLILAYLLPQPFWPRRSSRARVHLLAWPWARAAIFVPVAILLVGWALGVSGGWRAGVPEEIWTHLPAAVLTTLSIGLAVGLLHLILFLLTAYVLPHDGWERFLNGYLAPSAAVTGFGLLLIPIEGVELVKLVVALTLISYPLLYRWIVHAALAEVQGQVITARTMGASWSQILFEIVWPQLAPALLRASGLAAVWACGDFALSGILLNGGSGTLPLLISDLISNYRIEVAAVLLLPLSLASIGLYVLFRGAARYVTN